MIRDTDRSYWAEASALVRALGRGALEHAAAQIAAHMHAGDDVQMLHWFEVHERIEEALAEDSVWPIVG